MYPMNDSKGRQGMYCQMCGAILYIPNKIASMVRKRQCPICGCTLNNATTLRWITNDEKWQPDGDGF